MVAEALMDQEFYITAIQNWHSLTIAGAENVKAEIINGVKTERRNLASSHEEADHIIAQQAIVHSQCHEVIKVVSDDTDVFSLLRHLYVPQNCTSVLHNSSLQRDWSVIDMREQLEITRLYQS